MALGDSFYLCLFLVVATLLTVCRGQCNGTAHYLWATEEWTTITSPSYIVGSYPPNQPCQWRIAAIYNKIHLVLKSIMTSPYYPCNGSLSIYDGFYPHYNSLLGSFCQRRNLHFYSSGEYMLITMSSLDLDRGAIFTIKYRTTDSTTTTTTTARHVTTSTRSTPGQGGEGSIGVTGIFALTCIVMAAILLGVACVLCRRRRRRRRHPESSSHPIPRLFPRPSLHPQPRGARGHHADTGGLFTLSEGVLAHSGNTNSCRDTSAHSRGNVNMGFVASVAESPPSYGEVVAGATDRRTRPGGGATASGQTGVVTLPSYEQAVANDSASTRRREGGDPSEQAGKESLPSYDEAISMLDRTPARRSDSGYPSNT